MNTTQIFSENQLRAQLKNYIKDEITFCDKRIRECKFILTSDNSTTEDREEAHRKLEMVNFIRYWLYEQMDNLLGAELNEYINRK